MVRLLTVSGIIVVSMASICAADVETFTWEEGRFTILFADKPKEGQQVIRLPVGNVTMHIFTAEFPHQTGEMVVSYADYPAQALATRKADEMLDDSVTGTIKGMTATLVKSDRVDQAGSPGRAFSWTKGPLKGKGRIFLVGPRLCKVVEESDAQIAGYEGHAYRLDVAGPKPVVVAARAAIVGKRTVVLYVIGNRAAVAGPSAERFLDSVSVDN